MKLVSNYDLLFNQNIKYLFNLPKMSVVHRHSECIAVCLLTTVVLCT